MLLVHKTCLYILDYIIYIFVWGVDAPKANLLKKAQENGKTLLKVGSFLPSEHGHDITHSCVHSTGIPQVKFPR